MLSEIIPQWTADILSSYEGDSLIEELMDKLNSQSDSEHNHHLTRHQQLIRYKQRICVGNKGDWRETILKEMHASRLGGHSGVTATYHRLKR